MDERNHLEVANIEPGGPTAHQNDLPSYVSNIAWDLYYFGQRRDDLVTLTDYPIVEAVLTLENPSDRTRTYELLLDTPVTVNELGSADAKSPDVSPGETKEVTLSAGVRNGSTWPEESTFVVNVGPGGGEPDYDSGQATKTFILECDRDRVSCDGSGGGGGDDGGSTGPSESKVVLDSCSVEQGDDSLSFSVVVQNANDVEATVTAIWSVDGVQVASSQGAIGPNSIGTLSGTVSIQEVAQQVGDGTYDAQANITVNSL